VLPRLTRLIETLGVNSLPVVGVVAGDWSWATVLSLYWAENLIAAVLIGLRLWLHRRWRADAGQASPEGLKAPGPFLGTTLAFNLAHGLFLALVLAGLLKAWPDLATLQQAIVVLLVMQALAFGVDLWSLEQWPVARVNERADHLLGRVVLVHLSIIAGMVSYAVFDTEWAFFAVFAGFKVLSDAATLLPRAAVAADSKAPPGWLAAIARRLPTRNGDTFEQYWARTQQPGGDGAASAPTRRRKSERPG